MIQNGPEMNSNNIDVHFHIFPDFYREVVVASSHVVTTGYLPAWSPEAAIEMMDRQGIATGITSLVNPGVHFGDDQQAQRLARRCNETVRAMMDRWPGRFGAFATLPLPDVEGALAEIDFCFDVLDFDGVCLHASYGELFLGHEKFDPILAALNDRDAVVFIHPVLHPSSRSIGLAWPGFMMEFLFDTTRAAVNLIFSGSLERYPRIRFILSHAGGVLPYFSWRLSVASMVSPRLEGWTEERVLQGISSFYFDTALSAGPQTFGCLDQVANPSKILFGSDWPFAPEPVTQKSIITLSETLPPHQRNAIARDNALALFPRYANVAVGGR